MINALMSMRLLASIVLVGGLASLGLPARAQDQEARIKTLERRLEDSLKLVERLAARVAELERAAGGQATATGPAAAASAAAATVEAARPHDGAHQAPSPGSGYHGFQNGQTLHGFADTSAAWSSGADPVRLRGFTVGTLGLYLTPEVSDRVRGLMEMVFEYDDGEGWVADMERLQLGYTVSDALTVWLGRYHTPYGLWNTAFHHGANLQTSIYRPRFIGFEDTGGILPAHSVGLWGTGKVRLGDGRLTYDAYLSNGSSIRGRRLDPNNPTDDTDNKQLGFNLGYQPTGRLDGLTVGVHGFGSTVGLFGSSSTPLGRTRLRAAGGYFGYDSTDWEALGEYYRFANTDVESGVKHFSSAWFVQVGRNFGALTPFVRLERAALDAEDNYFRGQLYGRSYRRLALGARYALDPQSSIKLEWSRTREAAMSQLDENGLLVPFAGGRYHRTAVQYSISF